LINTFGKVEHPRQRQIILQHLSGKIFERTPLLLL